jgi:hypothetical protein
MRQTVGERTSHDMREESHQQQKKGDEDRRHPKPGKSNFQISLGKIFRCFFRVIHFQSPEFRSEPVFGPAGKVKAASIGEKIQEPIYVSLSAKSIQL